MNNKITKSTDLRLNDEGNQILDEEINGGGKIQTIKYGLIKLMGEKQEHRVSYKTMLAINEAKNANFTGNINIPELNMAVQASQIVMLRSDIEHKTVIENFTKLPTANLCLDLNLRPLNMTRPQLLREQKPYYEATVHYLERNGERQYYLEFDKIKKCIKIDYDAEKYDYVANIYEYGIEKTYSNAK